MFQKLLSISLSPNVQRDDLLLTWKYLFRPWLWKKGRSISELEDAFRSFFGVSDTFALNSGRSCLYLLLRAFGIKKGDEILLQAFTCSAVPAPILWHGAQPIYVDVDADTLTLDTLDLEKKITPRSKGIIVQHTFGQAAHLHSILQIARKHHLFVIEDCAHSIGNEYHGQKLGTFGDAAFLSFGRDKVISCVYGGMILTRDAELGQKLRALIQETPFPSLFWIKQQLLHPILMNCILRTYTFGGKFLLVLLQHLKILSKAISKVEYHGGQPGYFPRKLPNVLAALALHQFRKLERFQEHRRKISLYYDSALEPLRVIRPKSNASTSLLRYTIRTPRAHEILEKAKRRGILLGDWYTKVIAPEKVDLQAFSYRNGSCPVAQRLSEETLNLPTHINIREKDAQRIVRFLITTLHGHSYS